MPQARKPESVSLILCDAVYSEPATGKLTILGTIDIIHHNAFPCSYPCLFAFVELTKGQGEADVTLKVTRLPADKPEPETIATFQPPQKVVFEDPRQVVKTLFNATSVVFPEPGEYRFTIEWNGEFVAQRRLTAIRRES